MMVILAFFKLVAELELPRAGSAVHITCVVGRTAKLLHNAPRLVVTAGAGGFGTEAGS